MKRRIEIKKAVLGIALVSFLYLIKIIIDALETDSYTNSSKTVNLLLIMPAVYLFLGWTCIQIIFLLIPPTQLKGNGAMWVKRILVIILGCYFVMVIPVCVWTIWCAVQVSQKGTFDSTFFIGENWNWLFVYMKPVVTRSSLIFSLFGGALRLCGFPKILNCDNMCTK